MHPHDLVKWRSVMHCNFPMGCMSPIKKNLFSLTTEYLSGQSMDRLKTYLHCCINEYKSVSFVFLTPWNKILMRWYQLFPKFVMAQMEFAYDPGIWSFQWIHPKVPLTTSLVMFFPRLLGVSGLSTSYTFTWVTQLVLISRQLVVSEYNCSNLRHPTTPKNMRLYTK